MYRSFAPLRMTTKRNDVILSEAKDLCVSDSYNVPMIPRNWNPCIWRARRDGGASAAASPNPMTSSCGFVYPTAHATKKAPTRGAFSVACPAGWRRKRRGFAEPYDFVMWIRISHRACHKKGTHKGCLFCGVPGGIRTHGLQSRSLTRYPASLRAHGQH